MIYTAVLQLSLDWNGVESCLQTTSAVVPSWPPRPIVRSLARPSKVEQLHTQRDCKGEEELCGMQ